MPKFNFTVTVAVTVTAESLEKAWELMDEHGLSYSPDVPEMEITYESQYCETPKGRE